jgi:DNA helicase II / ATP-dependent DNA helicase PcrA
MTDPSSPPSDIPQQELCLLQRVQDNLAAQTAKIRSSETYDIELVSLRDQISEARLEDVPALVAQMERFAGISAQRSELQATLVDPASPYFAHMRLRETDKQSTREREVLIGRTTYIDSPSNVRVVDWRHAPVSQLYYRYSEGDDYEATFGDREVEGQVVVRRTVTITSGSLLRIACPQGTFVRTEGDAFRVIETREAHLAGGQGKATRPSEVRVRGVLGVGPTGEQRLDRHLPEISALLDPRQFELISRPDAGMVVIQGGAGSGKTTIGLHRIAFLNYQAPKRFAGDRMMVITTTPGLVAYTSQVLPALEVRGVSVATFCDWAARQRRTHFPWLSTVPVTDETPSAVSVLKKHPAVLRLIEQRAEAARADPKARTDPHTPVTVWAEALTDLSALKDAIAKSDSPAVSDRDVRLGWQWCSSRCAAVADVQPGDPREKREAAKADDDDVRGDVGVDGAPTEDNDLQLDPEDEALLLRAYQLARGPLRRGKEPLHYEHLFVDEAQDLSVAELAVLIEVTTDRRSITLAGDTSQRLVHDNSFRGWHELFSDLGIQAFAAIEPLRIAYRSTREVMELARDVLGPLGDALPSEAPRTGAPVEMFMAPSAGVAVGVLAEALRALALREPRATVGILARYPEQADIYYEGLSRSEVPNLRRVRAQDFTFRPGVDVTEIREVKGLEYDYVILVDVNASAFPADDESRHLMHVGATRAAHQLWIVATGEPSKILPKWLLEAAM